MDKGEKLYSMFIEDDVKRCDWKPPADLEKYNWEHTHYAKGKYFEHIKGKQPGVMWMQHSDKPNTKVRVMSHLCLHRVTIVSPLCHPCVSMMSP